MSTPMRHGLLFALVVLGIVFYETMRPEPQPPGVLAPAPPTITALESERPPVFEREGHVLTALARFEARARVVAIERYSREREASVAPMDIALAWGRLSDSRMLKNVDLAQSKRELLFKSYDPALPDSEMEASVFNLHVVGADADVDKQLKALRAGMVVKLQGHLVEARAADGWRWRGQARAASPKAPGSLLRIARIEIEAAAPPKAAK